MRSATPLRALRQLEESEARSPHLQGSARQREHEKQERLRSFIANVQSFESIGQQNINPGNNLVYDNGH